MLVHVQLKKISGLILRLSYKHTIKRRFTLFALLGIGLKMPKRSKLLQALDEHKGRDYDAEKQKKLLKAAKKRKGLTGKEEEKVCCALTIWDLILRVVAD